MAGTSILLRGGTQFITILLYILFERKSKKHELINMIPICLYVKSLIQTGAV